MNGEAESQEQGTKGRPTFTTTRIPYVPALDDGISTAPHNTHLAFNPEMVVSPAEHFDWGTVRASAYVDVAVMDGHYRSTTSVLDRFPGHGSAQLSRAVKKCGRWFRDGRSHYGKHGAFHVLWGWAAPWPRWFSACDFRIIFSPRFRAPIRETVGWMQDVISAVDRSCVWEPLHLAKIELAVDFLGDFDREGLVQCFKRNWGKEIVVCGQTAYDGRRRSARKTALYEKEERGHEAGWHVDARFGRRALRRRRILRPTPAAMMLLLGDLWDNQRFRYLDLRKLAKARTKKCRENAIGYWRLFLAEGCRAAERAMAVDGISNPGIKFSVHPLDAVYRRALAGSFADVGSGLRLSHELTGLLGAVGEDAGRVGPLLQPEVGAKVLDEYMEIKRVENRVRRRWAAPQTALWRQTNAPAVL